ncbi:hypothetical protein HYT23_05475 [Candidatus Pacearchaeota archaeon]|nr:hypothetical protein [Candidatus Pacearchaeota archaeon]
MARQGHKTLELRIDIEKAIPKLSNSDNSFGYISMITNIFPCGENGGRILRRFENAELVRVQIESSGGGSGQIYSMDDFRRFKEGYCVRNPEDLIGELVIGVYTKNHGEALIGLIPVNLRNL